jgi:hypothetical protein
MYLLSIFVLKNKRFHQINNEIYYITPQNVKEKKELLS